MEPVIQHPEQEQAAREKLAALEKRFGKKPNILIFLMDDVGWMDPGFNGGGEAVGNPTPTMDRLAHEGLDPDLGLLDPKLHPDACHHHTGQNPLHHGLLRPPMYGEPGGLDGAVTVADHSPEVRLRDPGRRQVAHGRKRGLSAPERGL